MTNQKKVLKSGIKILKDLFYIVSLLLISGALYDKLHVIKHIASPTIAMMGTILGYIAMPIVYMMLIIIFVDTVLYLSACFKKEEIKEESPSTISK